ncbi:MAG: hypothetical protein IPF77_00640 [Gemmatimonadetes bacterium]|jgi:hypothetical protein|nr:hypothetical protein [Gemmatimonadota bacterium]MBK9692524.1 hypothetical protein [Gemmatimonadota bacterium]MBP9198585.1 hypothetical protein [Gemmatimonadales bacterium]
MTPATDRAALLVPELGPGLGRLVAPPPAPGAPQHWIALDDIRLALVTQLFDLAGDARRWAREGDRELALATLDGTAWATAWQVAVGTVAQRAAAAISARLLAAAAEVRLPAARARRLPLDQQETLALAGRLGRGTGALQAALAALDQAIPGARAAGSGQRAWQDAVGACARRLEAAWIALEEALHEEWRRWDAEIADLRAWRRPRWPLVLSGLALFGAAACLGLVLGGYLPVPDFLRSFVEMVWARWN